MANDIFDPGALEQMCHRDLAGALRQLADHLERREISATLWSLQGNGMVQDWSREHVLMKLNGAVAQVIQLDKARKADTLRRFVKRVLSWNG